MLVYVMRSLFAESAWLKTSERAIAFSIWVLAILYFVGVLPEVARELDAVVLPFGKPPVSLLTVAKGASAVILTLVITLWLSGLIEQRLSTASAIDTNTRALLVKFLRAVLLVVGVLIALRAIGFDLTLLTVFGGALGVGVGLGLQKFAANYIAGFTILLDKSIRLGDMITVDNRQGRVAKVTSRYVVLRALDGIEAIVPNETLVTTTVLNHSHASHDIRVATSGAHRLRRRRRACHRPHAGSRARRNEARDHARAACGVRQRARAKTASTSSSCSGWPGRKRASRPFGVTSTVEFWRPLRPKALRFPLRAATYG